MKLEEAFHLCRFSKRSVPLIFFSSRFLRIQRDQRLFAFLVVIRVFGFFKCAASSKCEVFYFFLRSLSCFEGDRFLEHPEREWSGTWSPSQIGTFHKIYIINLPLVHSILRLVNLLSNALIWHRSAVAGGSNVQVKMFIPGNLLEFSGFLWQKTTEKANERISSTQRASKNRKKKKTSWKAIPSANNKNSRKFQRKENFLEKLSSRALFWKKSQTYKMEDSLPNTEKRKTKRSFSVFKRTFPMHVSFFLSRAGNKGNNFFWSEEKVSFLLMKCELHGATFPSSFATEGFCCEAYVSFGRETTWRWGGLIDVVAV
jgi:hypothetical protein